MDIDWNDESDVTASSTSPTPEEQASPPRESSESASSPATPSARKIAIDGRGFSLTYVSALSAVLLVAAIAAVGFVFGHYVVKPNSPIVQSPSYAKTNLPGNGSGGFEIPNFGS